MNSQELVEVMKEFKDRLRTEGEEAASEYWRAQGLTRYIGPILTFWVKGLIVTTKKGASRKLNKQVILLILQLSGLTDATDRRSWVLWRRATEDSSILDLRLELSFEAAMECEPDEDDSDQDQSSKRAWVEWKRKTAEIELPDDLRDVLGERWMDWAIDHRRPDKEQQQTGSEGSDKGDEGSE